MTEAQIVFAETAIMLLHPDEKRRAVAKERIYAIMYRSTLEQGDGMPGELGRE